MGLDNVRQQLATRFGEGATLRLRVLDGGGVCADVGMIGIGEMVFFQPHDKPMRVVTGDGEVIIRMPLKEWLEGLDPQVFW